MCLGPAGIQEAPLGAQRPGSQQDSNPQESHPLGCLPASSAAWARGWRRPACRLGPSSGGLAPSCPASFRLRQASQLIRLREPTPPLPCCILTCDFFIFLRGSNTAESQIAKCYFSKRTGESLKSPRNCICSITGPSLGGRSEGGAGTGRVEVGSRHL